MQRTRRKTASLPTILFCLGAGLALFAATCTTFIGALIRDGDINWTGFFYGLIFAGAFGWAGCYHLTQWRTHTPPHVRRKWWLLVAQGTYLFVSAMGCLYGIFVGVDQASYVLGGLSLLGFVLVLRSCAVVQARAKALEQSPF